MNKHHPSVGFVSLNLIPNMVVCGKGVAGRSRKLILHQFVFDDHLCWDRDHVSTVVSGLLGQELGWDKNLNGIHIKYTPNKLQFYSTDL